MIVRKAEVKKFDWKVIVYPVIGLFMMFGIMLLPTNLLSIGDRSNPISYLPMLLAGIVVAIALVLPGISVSYMLLVLGLYEETMKAIWIWFGLRNYFDYQIIGASNASLPNGYIFDYLRFHRCFLY